MAINRSKSSGTAIFMTCRPGLMVTFLDRLIFVPEPWLIIPQRENKSTRRGNGALQSGGECVICGDNNPGGES